LVNLKQSRFGPAGFAGFMIGYVLVGTGQGPKGQQALKGQAHQLFLVII
jgi:hypothetical protein